MVVSSIENDESAVYGLVRTFNVELEVFCHGCIMNVVDRS